jgi:CYTH domain-containing protein
VPPGGADPLTRLEFEYPIPPADAESLLALTDRQVGKRRYGLDLPGGAWVLDVFEGANAPLVVAEVELGSADQPLAVPDWCVRELSGRHELSNAALAVRPLADWSEAERRSLLQGPTA